MTDTPEEDAALTRTQLRLLRRIYNGRSVPIVADGVSFLTYKEARRHVLALTPAARDMAYAAMKAQAKAPRQEN